MSTRAETMTDQPAEGEIVAFPGGKRCRICNEQLDHKRARQLEAVEAWYRERPGLLEAERAFHGRSNFYDKASQCRRCQEADEGDVIQQMKLHSRRRREACWQPLTVLPD